MDADADQLDAGRLQAFDLVHGGAQLHRAAAEDGVVGHRHPGLPLLFYLLAREVRDDDLSPCHPGKDSTQLSTAGLVVGVALLTEAVTPDSEGMENQLPSQADGEVLAMVA